MNKQKKEKQLKKDELQKNKLQEEKSNGEIFVKALKMGIEKSEREKEKLRQIEKEREE